VSVVTYGLWDGHNSNSMTLCDTWGCVLVATCGVYVLQLFRCCFGAEVLPPKRGVAVPSLAGSISGSGFGCLHSSLAGSISGSRGTFFFFCLLTRQVCDGRLCVCHSWYMRFNFL